MTRFSGTKWAAVGCAFAVGVAWLTYQAQLRGRLADARVKAAQADDPDAVTRLLREGADPNARVTYHNPVRDLEDVWNWVRRDGSVFWHDSPLVVDMAAHGGRHDLRTVEILLDAGAHVDSRDNMGRTALMVAANADRRAMVRLLLRRGADRQTRASDGWTALDEATQNGHQQVVAILKRRE